MGDSAKDRIKTSVNKRKGLVASVKEATCPASEDCAGGACFGAQGDMVGGPVGLGEGQSLIPSPVKKKEAKEAYLNNGTFDEDQELTIQVMRENGTDLEPYVTPDNSPEQMFELAEAISLGVPPEKIRIMADPSISFMALQVVNKAYKAGIDLTVYLPWADPFVLNQALLGIRKGLDPSKFIKKGLDHRQIEQLRKELEAGGDPSSLAGNYNQMRAQRFPGHNISNMEEHIPKGQGVSTHSKKKK